MPLIGNIPDALLTLLQTQEWEIVEDTTYDEVDIVLAVNLTAARQCLAVCTVHGMPYEQFSAPEGKSTFQLGVGIPRVHGKYETISVRAEPSNVRLSATFTGIRFADREAARKDVYNRSYQYTTPDGAQWVVYADMICSRYNWGGKPVPPPEPEDIKPAPEPKNITSAPAPVASAEVEVKG